MSQNANKASNPEHDEQGSGSVYDFLYYDERRIGSFLSQFDEAGLLQQITQSEGAFRGGKRGWKFSAGGNVPLQGSANVGVEVGPAKGGFQGSDRVYNTRWANALTFLDFLAERELIERDLRQAGFGTFVLISGEVLLLDTGSTSPVMNVPEIKGIISRGISAQLLSSAITLKLVGEEQVNLTNNQKAKRAERDAKLLMEMASSLPPTVHMRLLTEDGQGLFCAIRNEGLTVPVSDITMNHGSLLQGSWNVLAIYDARPTPINLDVEAISRRFRLDDSMVLKFANAFAPFYRQIGRPDALHGVTPLLVFRQIGQPVRT